MGSSISISHHNPIASPPQNTNETNDQRNTSSQAYSREQETTSINTNNTPVFSLPKITITDPKNTDNTDINTFTGQLESLEQNLVLLKVGISSYNCINNSSSTPLSDKCCNSDNYNKRLDTIRETNSELYDTKRLHSLNVLLKNNNNSNNEDSNSIQAANDTKCKRSTIISNISANNVHKNTSRIKESYSYKNSYDIGLDTNSLHNHKVNQSKSWKYK